ncbi:hypothetical protein [Schaalia hyovaginalis]|uniref:Biopolymer transport protein ExbB/TolQ n=1 Tax=Schaalia hyovaginalis TaxID=29316 RepID=A0A923IZL0_9ACTO|nr:hypothetical protein [Schaalia hyovaginalis]MBB6335451.1 biopolymer transport protein ExbB/TolQ [Schaalia hyovaginalis]
MKILMSVLGSELDPHPTPPPNLEGPVNTLLSWFMWGGLVVAIVGFIVAGSALAIANHRGTSSEHVHQIGKVAVGAMLIASAAGLVRAIVALFG